MLSRRGRFTAATEDGAVVTVEVFTEYVLAYPPDGPPELLAGEPEFRTACGRTVERVGPGTFREVATGQLLRSADPAAG
jgi:hypothetical protein